MFCHCGHLYWCNCFILLYSCLVADYPVISIVTGHIGVSLSATVMSTLATPLNTLPAGKADCLMIMGATISSCCWLSLLWSVTVYCRYLEAPQALVRKFRVEGTSSLILNSHGQRSSQFSEVLCWHLWEWASGTGVVFSSSPGLTIGYTMVINQSHDLQMVITESQNNWCFRIGVVKTLESHCGMQGDQTSQS